MKRFLQDFILTSLIALCFILPVEWMGTKVTNETTYKRDYIRQHAEGIKTLLMGHSQFEASFNPHVLGDSVFMSSQMGRGLYYDVEMARRCVPTMPNLKALVYPIYIGNMAAGGKNLGMGIEYAKLWGIYCRNFPLNLASRSMLLSGSFSLNFFRTSVGCDSLGYHCFEDRWDGLRDGQHAISHPRKDVDDYMLQLTELARICHEHNVRLIAVACPLTNMYLSSCPAELYDEMTRVVAGVQSQYPIEFHDYTRDPDFRENTLYYDVNHLNHFGATLFAQRVKEDFGL